MLNRTRTARPFDLSLAISCAWELLWKANLKDRQEMVAGGHRYGLARTYFLTATDVERQVRQFAQEQQDGQPWGTSGRSYGHCTSVRIKTGTSMPLLDIVRRWLHSQYVAGKLDRHNSGKGHISGMRYRPHGEPISEAEKRTAVEKSKPRKYLVHYAAHSGAPMACRPNQKLSLFSRGRRPVTKYAENVTCPRCQAIMGMSR